MPRKGSWKQVRIDGELYALLNQKRIERGWRYDMTKFIEDVLWDYAYGRLIVSGLPQGGKIAIGAQGRQGPVVPESEARADTPASKEVHKRIRQRK